MVKLEHIINLLCWNRYQSIRVWYFSLRKSDIQVNGEVISTDAVPFVVDGMWMLPMRYFAEATNMKVEWNAEKATACAYGENKNIKVSIKGDKIYINSALWNGKEHAIE